MKTQNMRSPQGNKVPNQFIITDDEGNEFFQSYETVIAKRTRDGKIYLDNSSWDYSTTTGKYRNQFLGMDKKETEKAIKEGRIQLTDLNQ